MLFLCNPQNSANAAMINVVAKLTLKATLSSSNDLTSIPLTYLCILCVGTMLIPLEAAA